jgi:hypothetical protein
MNRCPAAAHSLQLYRHKDGSRAAEKLDRCHGLRRTVTLPNYWERLKVSQGEKNRAQKTSVVGRCLLRERRRYCGQNHRPHAARHGSSSDSQLYVGSYSGRRNIEHPFAEKTRLAKQDVIGLSSFPLTPPRACAPYSIKEILATLSAAYLNFIAGLESTRICISDASWNQGCIPLCLACYTLLHTW